MVDCIAASSLQTCSLRVAQKSKPGDGLVIIACPQRASAAVVGAATGAVMPTYALQGGSSSDYDVKQMQSNGLVIVGTPERLWHALQHTKPLSPVQLVAVLNPSECEEVGHGKAVHGIVSLLLQSGTLKGGVRSVTALALTEEGVGTEETVRAEAAAKLEQLIAPDTGSTQVIRPSATISGSGPTVATAAAVLPPPAPTRSRSASAAALGSPTDREGARRMRHFFVLPKTSAEGTASADGARTMKTKMKSTVHPAWAKAQLTGLGAVRPYHPETSVAGPGAKIPAEGLDSSSGGAGHHAASASGGLHRTVAESAAISAGMIAALWDQLSMAQTVVFAASRRQLVLIADELAAMEIDCQAWSPDLDEKEREAALSRYRTGECRVLLATDALVRDPQVPSAGCVLHCGVPLAPEVMRKRISVLRPKEDGEAASVLLLAAGAGDSGSEEAEAARAVEIVRACVGFGGIPHARGKGLRSVRTALEILEEDEEEEDEEEDGEDEDEGMGGGSTEPKTEGSLRSDASEEDLAACCMDSGLIAPLPANGSAWIVV